LSSQVLSQQQDSALEAWVRLLRGHASVIRSISAQLVSDHGLTVNDYEALLHLARAEDGRMRRVDLAERLILTASGVTRLLDGLETSGWVERASCASDRRVTYAVLTPAGRKKLREASESHMADIRSYFEARFSTD
jgi:DNA-binding MarR family transcriptional regulator